MLVVYSLRMTFLARLTSFPQLDICDLGQAFGVVAPCFASASNAILYSLLTFTVVSSNRFDTGTEESVRTSLVSRLQSIMPHVSDQDVSTNLLCSVLASCRDVLQRELGAATRQPLDHIVDLFNQSIIPYDSHPMTTPLYYLMLRFGSLSSYCEPIYLTVGSWVLQI